MNTSLNKALIIATLIFGSVGLTSTAEARGCIKGAVVGGIAGHIVHHGKAGALAGCAIGHHQANKTHVVKHTH